MDAGDVVALDEIVGVVLPVAVHLELGLAHLGEALDRIVLHRLRQAAERRPPAAARPSSKLANTKSAPGLDPDRHQAVLFLAEPVRLAEIRRAAQVAGGVEHPAVIAAAQQVAMAVRHRRAAARRDAGRHCGSRASCRRGRGSRRSDSPRPPPRRSRRAGAGRSPGRPVAIRARRSAGARPDRCRAPNTSARAVHRRRAPRCSVFCPEDRSQPSLPIMIVAGSDGAGAGLKTQEPSQCARLSTTRSRTSPILFGAFEDQLAFGGRRTPATAPRAWRPACGSLRPPQPSESQVGSSGSCAMPMRAAVLLTARKR